MHLVGTLGRANESGTVANPPEGIAMSTTNDAPISPARAATHTRRTALAIGAAAALALVLPRDLAAKKRKKTKTWRPSTTFGTEGAGEGQLDDPYGVAVSRNGRTALVADYNNDRISVWTRSSTSATTWTNSATFGGRGSESGQFTAPQGVAVSPDGLTAWVADSANHRISVWTRESTSATTWTPSTTFGTEGNGVGNLRYPNAVTASADGLTAWVSDIGNDRISVWARDPLTPTTWTNTTTFGSYGSELENFSGPGGIAVSTYGRTAWVADYYNHRIAIWTRQNADSSSWSPSTSFGTEGADLGNFDGPWGVDVSADGRTAWVADHNNHRISIWTRPTSSSAEWTNSGTFGSQGSEGDNFNRPNGVAASADGRTIWVADRSNNRISVWTYA